MPISEFKALGKPILVADCEYAGETVGDYGKAAFFDPDDAGRLAELMRAVLEKRFRPETRPAASPAPPYAQNWAELFGILLKE